MLKKPIALFLSVCLMFLFAACGNVADEQNLPPDEPEQEDSDSALNPSDNPFLSPQAQQKIESIYENASIGPQTVTTVQQLAILTSVCASVDGRGPISVTAATLNGEEITLLTLGGTQFVEGQATTVQESKLSMFGKPNDYTAAVEDLIRNGTIPAKKPLLAVGISLGGMIAQQILHNRALLNEFGIEMCGVICFGSPLTMPLERYGVPVVRFADVNDPVPKTENMLKNLGGIRQEAIDAANSAEKIVRNGQYTGIEAHALSYISEDCWNEFDFFGSPNKENVLVLSEEMQFYAALKRSETSGGQQ